MARIHFLNRVIFGASSSSKPQSSPRDGRSGSNAKHARKQNQDLLWAIHDMLKTSPRDKHRRCPPVLISDCGILLSSFYFTKEIAQLKRKHNITHVINMAHGDTVNDQRQELREAHGIKYLGIQAVDASEYDIMEHFPQVQHFAQSFFQEQAAGNPDARLLIHCMAGINRSAAMAVALVCWKEDKHLLNAIAQVQERRGTILLNTSFRNDLVNWARAEHRLPPPMVD